METPTPQDSPANTPFALVTRSEIEASAAKVDALESRLRSALVVPGGGR